jgi:predicted TIM-barrel fold metal-dependent hydrolase
MDEDKTIAANADDAQRYWLDEGYAEGGTLRQVDYAANSRGLDPSLAGIKIVDCDTHFSEPPDLFTSRAPARLKEKMPYHRHVDGRDRWYLGDKDFGAWGGGNVIGKDHNKLLGRLSYPNMAEGHPGSYQLKPRLQAMDDMGIYAQICYQNSGVTQAGSLMAMSDNEVAFTVLRIYNDAAAERQVESGQRLFTLAHLPIWDKKELETEARRCIDMNIKGFVLPDLPERLGIPSFVESYWDDFFAMCEATGTSLNFHLNAAINPGGMTWKGFSFEQTLSVASMMFSIGNAATMGNFMVSGRLDQYPKLKIGMIESGMGWVPFCLEALEHEFDEMLPKKAKTLQKRPWEYFADNFWVTYWFETRGPKLLLETLGVDKVLFETDFPHPTSLYPGVQDHLVKTLGGYDYGVRKKVLETNAVTLYNLPF